MYLYDFACADSFDGAETRKCVEIRSCELILFIFSDLLKQSKARHKDETSLMTRTFLLSTGLAVIACLHLDQTNKSSKPDPG